MRKLANIAPCNLFNCFCRTLILTGVVPFQHHQTGIDGLGPRTTTEPPVKGTRLEVHVPSPRPISTDLQPIGHRSTAVSSRPRRTLLEGGVACNELHLGPGFSRGASELEDVEGGLGDVGDSPMRDEGECSSNRKCEIT